MEKATKKLVTLSQAMSPKGQAALLDYAEFLAKRHTAESVVATTPQLVERPESESVIGAIKRLSAIYPMLDKEALFKETSSFMMQHMLHGKDAVEVIDQMEIYFEKQYRIYYENNAADT